MTKTAFVHVGTHKTGTSSIQAMLASGDVLERLGVYVPMAQQAGVNNLEVHHAAAERFVRGIEPNLPFAAILRSLERSDLPVAVISSENFECNVERPEVYRAIAEGLRSCGYEPRAVLYVREQNAYAESLYATLALLGLNRGFETYLDRLLESGRVEFAHFVYPFEYSRLADALSDGFGRDNVLVRRYRNDRRDDALLRDFLDTVSVRPPEDAILPALRHNSAPTFAQVLNGLYLNALHRPSGAPSPDALVDDAVRPDERSFLDRRFAMLAQPDEIRFGERFAKDNARLAERYGIVLDLEPRSSDGGTDRPADRLMRAAAAAWNVDGAVEADEIPSPDADAEWLRSIAPIVE